MPCKSGVLGRFYVMIQSTFKSDMRDRPKLSHTLEETPADAETVQKKQNCQNADVSR